MPAGAVVVVVGGALVVVVVGGGFVVVVVVVGGALVVVAVVLGGALVVAPTWAPEVRGDVPVPPPGEECVGCDRDCGPAEELVGCAPVGPTASDAADPANVVEVLGVEVLGVDVLGLDVLGVGAAPAMFDRGWGALGGRPEATIFVSGCRSWYRLKATTARPSRTIRTRLPYHTRGVRSRLRRPHPDVAISRSVPYHGTWARSGLVRPPPVAAARATSLLPAALRMAPPTRTLPRGLAIGSVWADRSNSIVPRFI